MGPGVRGNLVALGNHTLDQVRIRCSEVDSSLAVVVASDEESRVEIVYLEQVEKLCCVVVWPIII